MTKEPIISLSTSYLQDKFKHDGYAMLCKAAEMGFSYVELGHSTTVQSLEGIQRALQENIVKVSSLHNFCPIPPFASGACPNLYSPSTRSSSESEQWRRHTKTSLEFAEQCNAKVLVCHMGSLSYFFRKPDADLSEYFEDEKIPDSEELESNPRFRYTRDQFLKKSLKKSEKSYARIKGNIAQLYDFLSKKNIKIGVENRDNAPELPLDWNFDSFMSGLSEFPLIKAWHDVGHSKKKELMRLNSQLELIESTIDKIVGWHLHDCSKSGKDHIAIGKGDIDFTALSKFFNPQKHIFVLELNRAVRTQDAIDSLKRVQDML